MQERALAGYRVLDLIDEQGWLRGKMLTNLGADVSNVGPPVGDPEPQSDPFYDHTAGPDKSLPWFICNTYTCRMCLDLNRPQEVDLTLNPTLPSITPCGQDGPARDVQRTDRVCMAMGGFMACIGAANGRPVRIALAQAALHAVTKAARLLGRTRSRHHRNGCFGTDDDRYAAA